MKPIPIRVLLSWRATLGANWMLAAPLVQVAFSLGLQTGNLMFEAGSQTVSRQTPTADS
jgi:hypothetical protein